MDTNLRPSGIEGLGDMSWGTHFCLFYETKEDLLDFFIPFFKAGLEHDEFCLCVASEPLIAEEAERAMRQALPDFDYYLAHGQIEITPHTDWYLKEGRFDEQRVLQGWIDKLHQAFAKGFSGIRFAANILLERSDWESFARYEGKLEEALRDLQIEGLCAYNLKRYSVANVLDVIHHHQFTLARRDGIWQPLEGGRLKRAHEEVLRLNAELEQRVMARTAELTFTNERLSAEIVERTRAEESIRKSEQVLREAETLGHTGSWEHNLVTGEIFNTEENLRLFFGDDRRKGTPFKDYAQAVHPDDREFVRQRRAQLLTEKGPSDIEFRVVWPDGSIHMLFGRATVVYDESGQAIRVYGTNVDITERKQAEEAVRESQHLIRLVLATLPVGVAVMDQAGKSVLINDASKSIWGGAITSGRDRWAQTKGLWHDTSEMIAPTDWASERALSRGQTSLNELIDIETYDGQQKTIRNSAAPIRNAEGLIVGAVTVNEDVTERVRAEEEIKHQSARAETLVRIAARLNKQLDLDAVVQAVCEEAVDTFKVSQATMSL